MPRMPRVPTILVSLGVIVSGSAFGQTAPTTQMPPPPPLTQTAPLGQVPPPVATTTDSASKTATPPVPGANSFTESEARHRLEQHGYTTVSNLTKDDQGIWRGMAMKDGKSVPVALDYQGNIVSQ
jgi:putative membrane protein